MNPDPRARTFMKFCLLLFIVTYPYLDTTGRCDLKIDSASIKFSSLGGF